MYIWLYIHFWDVMTAFACHIDTIQFSSNDNGSFYGILFTPHSLLRERTLRKKYFLMENFEGKLMVFRAIMSMLVQQLLCISYSVGFLLLHDGSQNIYYSQ